VDEEERESVAAELARVRGEARARGARAPVVSPEAPSTPPAAREPGASTPGSAAAAAPPAPSAHAVNELWRAEGGSGALASLLERLLRGRLGAQRDWNAAQVRLDNEILRWVEERFAATHVHYDALLGAIGRRLDEADERHRRLEEELVAHVRELRRRVDLADADASRGRAALELQLDDLRACLARIERALDRRP
jgi:hypothetical protein